MFKKRIITTLKVVSRLIKRISQTCQFRPLQDNLSWNEPSWWTNAMDAVRQTPIADANPKLSVLEEVYSSERFIVRIYKVKNPILWDVH